MPPKATPLATRFAAKWTANTSGCWIWTAARCRFGYGVIGTRAQRARLAHRVSWELHRGAIPDGLCVLHMCDVPACVNPSHLFLGTRRDNNVDMHAKGRNGYTGIPGEQHPMARLSWSNVRDIRKRVAAGERRAVVCREYGIASSTVHAIVKGLLWKETR